MDRARALRALRLEQGDVNGALLRATAEEVESPRAPPPEAEAAPSAMQHLNSLWQGVSQQAQHMTQLGASRLQGLGAQLGPRPPEEPAPRAPLHVLLVPGQVIHLYRRNGLARAAACPADHDALRRIIPSQDMLNDHKMDSYVPRRGVSASSAASLPS